MAETFVVITPPCTDPVHVLLVSRASSRADIFVFQLDIAVNRISLLEKVIKDSGLRVP